MAPLNKCCGCFTLRTGTRIILCINAISSLPYLRHLAEFEYISLLPFYIIHAIALILGFIAVMSKRPSFLLLYAVVYLTTSTAFTTHQLNMITNSKDGLYQWLRFNIKKFEVLEVIIIASIILSSGLVIYFTIVMYSYFEELRKNAGLVESGRSMLRRPEKVV